MDNHTLASITKIIFGVVLFLTAGFIVLSTFQYLKRNEAEATCTREQVVSYVKENEIPVYLDGENIDIDSVDLQYYDWSFNEEKNVLRLHERKQSSGSHTTVVPVPIFMQ